MTARTFLYSTLTSTPGVTELIGGDDPRVFAKKSMTSSIEQHPYVVYKLGNNTNESLSESDDTVSRQFAQIFVHDHSDGEVADYMRIDQVLAEIKKAFNLASSPEDGVIAVQYLETSQDLDDQTLNTVMKYVRYQLITKDK